jgi:hypothetical protein
MEPGFFRLGRIYIFRRFRRMQTPESTKYNDKWQGKFQLSNVQLAWHRTIAGFISTAGRIGD